MLKINKDFKPVEEIQSWSDFAEQLKSEGLIDGAFSDMITTAFSKCLGSDILPISAKDIEDAYNEYDITGY